VCADMTQHTGRIARMDRAQACVLVARTCVSAGRFPEARAMLEGVRVIGSQADGAEALGVWWRRALSLLVALYAQVRASLAMHCTHPFIRGAVLRDGLREDQV